MLNSIVNAERIRVPGERFYDTELYGKNLTVMQAKTLQRLSFTQDLKGIIKLIGENLNYDVNKIYYADFTYILHWFRLKSFSDFPKTVEFQCPFCSQRQTASIRSDKNLTIIDAPAELNEHAGVYMRFDNYPNGLFIRAQKVGDEFITSSLMRKYNIDEDDVDVQSTLLDLNLLRNQENGMDIEQLFQEFKNNKFTPNDLMAIMNFRSQFDWGVNDTYKFECEKCKEEVTVHETLDITQFFLQPSKSESAIRERILSNVKSQTTDQRAGGDVS